MFACALFGAISFGPGISLPVHAENFRVIAGHSEIVFDGAAGVPLRWSVCMPGCADPSARRAVLLDEQDGFFLVATPGSSNEAFTPSLRESENEVIVEFAGAQGNRVYRLSNMDARVSIELPPGSSLKLATGAVFIPEQLPGFGQIYSRVKGVLVDQSGQTVFDDPDQPLTELRAGNEVWVGMRSRYWTILVHPLAGQLAGVIDTRQLDRPVLDIAGDDGDSPVALEMYAGPVAWASLKNVSPVLSEMLFAALWDFLRALCFGMLWLLEWLQSLVGSFGFAIVLLSLSNKILLTPLTMLADRWQADVNRTHTLLKPELDKIKLNYKGEEAHMRTLDVYKRNNISQFYTFKSAAGFLIQIPVFIAAFDMLAENIALNEIAFLWASDLAKPDRAAALPFVLPFFGGWLNALPFLMTGLSVLSAWLQADESLSPDLQRRQSVNLYIMSAAFFVLFYTFPAGMVLYWTSSNLFHLLKVESVRLLGGLNKHKD
jgi:YidC/Oxa1 family membrane protein insertase